MWRLRTVSISLFFLLMIQTVNGATVTFVPRRSSTNPGITINTKFGYLNTTLAETVNSLTVYANGTMFFDVSGTTATQQGTYGFMTKSYGNGTLVLRFAGPKPVSVTGSPASSVYSDASAWQQITYTASQSSQLVIFYAPIIVFGIVATSGLFQVIMVATGMMYASSGIGTVMRVFGNGRGPKVLLDTKTILVTGVVGTMGFLFMLIVGANLIRPACPVGFTCTG